MIKLNLGCGDNKLNDFINIDIEKSCKPDLVLNFILEPLPYENESVEKIVMFHTIEHIQKCYHKKLLCEIWRVLKYSGDLLISYPEFRECYRNWSLNYKGKREFWEATIFGRQLYLSDHHVCIMDSAEFSATLLSCGFDNIIRTSETFEPYNSIIRAVKVISRDIPYEEWLRTDMESIQFLK